MNKQQAETNRGLLEVVINLCNKAKSAELLLGKTVASIEEFLYGNVVQNLLRTILDENNSQELEEEFGIDEVDISKIRLSPSLVAFTTDEDPKGNAQDYTKFKEIMSSGINPRMVDFISCFENSVFLKECENEITELKKLVITEEQLAKKIRGSIQVGFTDPSGNFGNLGDSKFNYFNKYSDEQLDEMYEKSSYNREAIDKVREFRKRQKK